jgi:hypothetical protein
MSPGIEQVGGVVYDVVHFSDRFPVVRAACGKVGPASDLWRYVTCLECLAAAPDDPRIAARRVEVIERQRGRREETSR